MQKQSVNAETRKEFGKNANNRLRSKGYIPAVMYSHGKTENLQILQKDLFKVFKGHISESVLFDVNIVDNQSNPRHQVFVKDYQINPITDEIIHLDLFKITEGEKIHTRVAVELTGTSKGVRQGGILEFVERELEIECLPAEIPEKITIDVTNLEIGDSIHIKDIPVSGSLKFLGDQERVVITVLVPHKAEEPKPAEEAAASPEAQAQAAEETKKEE